MEILALLISILALILGSIAYFRSGGKQDISAMERALSERIEALKSLIHQTGDSLVAGVKAGYQRSSRAINELMALVAVLGEAAAEEIRNDLKAVSETLEQLAERAGREIKAVKTGMEAAVVEAEEALRRAVEEARARLAVIAAKQHLLFARLAVLRPDLEVAEAQVTAAIADLKTARSLTGEHTKSLETVQQQAQHLLAEIQAKAASIKLTLDSLIEQNNHLLAEMSNHSHTPQMATQRASR